MTTSQADILTVGKLGKVYGLKGWLRLISYTEPQTNIFDYMPWYKQQRQQWQPCEVEAYQRHAGGWIVKLAGCEDRDQAARYVNAHIGVPKACLPPCLPGEFYWHELTGLQVKNKQGDVLGTVTDVIQTGANDVLIIREGAHEQWVPYLDDVIGEVDLTNKTLQVDWDKDG